MPVINDADHNRHRTASDARKQSPHPEVALSPADQEEMWRHIALFVVPRIVERLVMQARIAFSAGREAEARCYLAIEPSLLPDGTNMLKMAKLQLMLDQMVDYFPLRDGFTVGSPSASRLRRLFDEAIARVDGGYTISVEPEWFSINSPREAGKMLAKHIRTHVILEPKQANLNAGPRRYRKEAEWTREFTDPASE